MAVEVVETSMVEIVEVGMPPSHRGELPARDSHSKSLKTRMAVHCKPAAAKCPCPMRNEHHSPAPKAAVAATKATACFGRGHAQQQSQT
jgi:hypothetical protein